MKSVLKKIFAVAVLVMLVLALSSPAFAAGEAPETDAAQTQEADSVTGDKAMAAALCVGVAATAGAIGMAIAIAKSAESIARQPEADGKIRTSLMLGLVFIETAIIYALIVAILIIFVL